MRLCRRGERHERLLAEAVWSMLALVYHFKKVMNRAWE